MRTSRQFVLAAILATGTVPVIAQTWQLADDATIRARLTTYVDEHRFAPGVVIGVLDLSATAGADIAALATALPAEPGQVPSAAPPSVPATDPVTEGSPAATDPSRAMRFFAQGTSGRRGVPLDAGTLFELGSITKGFTALLYAEAVVRAATGSAPPAAGPALTLESTVGDVLPAADAEAALRALKLADLATHQSGLPRLSLRPLDLLPALFSADPYAGTTVAQVFAAAAGSPGRSTPGEFAYSNLGYAVLGQTLATAAQREFPTLLGAELPRLGLTAAVLSPDAAPPDRLARGFRPNFRPTAHWHMDAYGPAGALVGSAQDLLAFFQQQLTAPSPGWTLATTPRHALDDSGRRHIGLGWFLRRGDNGTLIWHNGGTGGFRTFAAVIPEQRLALVVLANGTGGDVDALARSLLDPAALPPAAPPRPWVGIGVASFGLIAAPIAVWVRRRRGARVAREPDRVDTLALVLSATCILAVTGRLGAWQIIPLSLWWLALGVTAVGAARVCVREWPRRPWLRGQPLSRALRLTQLTLFLLLTLGFA